MNFCFICNIIWKFRDLMMSQIGKYLAFLGLIVCLGDRINNRQLATSPNTSFSNWQGSHIWGIMWIFFFFASCEFKDKFWQLGISETVCYFCSKKAPLTVAAWYEQTLCLIQSRGLEALLEPLALPLVTLPHHTVQNQEGTAREVGVYSLW